MPSVCGMVNNGAPLWKKTKWQYVFTNNRMAITSEHAMIHFQILTHLNIPKDYSGNRAWADHTAFYMWNKT